MKTLLCAALIGLLCGCKAMGFDPNKVYHGPVDPNCYSMVCPPVP
jgi:hypothetical protein